jgi:hypothetical protein
MKMTRGAHGEKDGALLFEVRCKPYPVNLARFLLQKNNIADDISNSQSQKTGTLISNHRIIYNT